MRKILFFALATTIISIFPMHSEGAQNSIKHPEPLIVSHASIPIYPIIPRGLGLQGEVEIKAITNGKRVKKIKLIKGHEALARSAIKNIYTWRFEKHDPREIIITFKYALTDKTTHRFDNGTVTLRLPYHVQIESAKIVVRDPVKSK